MSKKHIAVLMGGWSCEREVSLSSGTEVVKELQNMGYSVTAVDVKRDIHKLVHDLSNPRPDIAFNALHGVGGEDGIVQGVLEMLQIPYTHSGVTASALAMNKIFSRKVFDRVGFKTPAWKLISFKELENGHPMELPYVIKPVNEGSSRGVSIIFNDNDYITSLKDWTFGEKVLVEKYIPGREIHVAVVDEKAIGAIEIKPLEGFYDYTAKYTPGKAIHLMPAPLSPQAYEEALALALKAHKVLGCRGVTRADFRYHVEDGIDPQFYILEVNTQPGMTPLSLVPEIAAHVGISFPDLLEKMIQSAQCDH